MTTITINQCLSQLQTLFNAAFVTGSGGDGTADYVYDYRTFPDKLPKTIALSFQGRGEYAADNGGRVVYYDVTAVVGIQIALGSDGQPTETAIRDADQALNVLEFGIYTLLDVGGTGHSGTYWKAVQFPQASIRPPSPIVPTTRRAEIPLRLILSGGVKRFGG